MSLPAQARPVDLRGCGSVLIRQVHKVTTQRFGTRRGLVTRPALEFAEQRGPVLLVRGFKPCRHHVEPPKQLPDRDLRAFRNRASHQVPQVTETVAYRFRGTFESCVERLL